MQRQMIILCPSCGGNVSASLDDVFTRCEHCGTNIDLRFTLSMPECKESAAAQKYRLPASARVKAAPDAIQLSFPLFDQHFLLPKFVQWFVISSLLIAPCGPFFLGTLLLISDPSDTSLDWLLSVPATIVTFILVNLGAMGFYRMERIVITATPARLTIDCEPLPWFGSHSFLTTRMAKLLCVARRQHRVTQQTNDTENLALLFGQTSSYELDMLKTDGSVAHLLTGQATPEYLRFAKRVIEDWLRTHHNV